MGRNDDNFDEATYIKVNERLAAFRKEFPEGLLTTFRGEDSEGIFYKCVVFRNPKEAELYGPHQIAASSGTAYLPEWAAQEESPKVEEATETAAVGRALAFMGYRVERSIASSEEMQRFEKMHGESEEEEEEVKAKAKKSRTRMSTRTSVRKAKTEDDNVKELPKLRSSRNFSRGSKLSSRKRVGK